MKNLINYSLLITFSMVCFQAYSQIEKTTYKIDEKTVELNDIDFNKAVIKALKEKSNEEVLGTVRLIDNQVTNSSKETIKIQKVELHFNEGLLEFVRLTTEDFEKYEMEDKIRLKKSDFDTAKLKDINNIYQTINLSDIIDYTAKYDNRHYVTGSSKIELDKETKTGILKINTDLNTYVDYQIYSDFFGLTNRESNGIIQAEASSRIILKPFPFNNKKSSYFLHSIEPRLKYSRLDSTDKYVIIDNANSISLNRLQIKQKAYLELGLRLNILKFKISQNNVEFYLGANFWMTDAQNTETEKQSSINSSSYELGLRGQVLKFRNFGLNCALNGELQRLNNKRFVFFNKYIPILTSEFVLFYYPHQNPKNKIFLRFQNVHGFQDKTDGIQYANLQIGFKSTLSLK